MYWAGPLFPLTWSSTRPAPVLHLLSRRRSQESALPMSTFRSLVVILVLPLRLTRHLLSDTVIAAHNPSNVYSTASAHSPFRCPSPLKSLYLRSNSLTARPTFAMLTVERSPEKTIDGHSNSSMQLVGVNYPLALPHRKLLTLAPPTLSFLAL
ncbi:hypothetical protein DFH09DRAFT_1428130 [Mycena vulgaris]|nr:hypothetical protein DFH09DRAFT_1428130 [Mycena vulgaris]